jgi:DNA-binding transcriptional MerR regulator
MKKYYYTIGEVCNLLDLKPHVVRYWETEFRQLNPTRTKGRSRRYTAEQIEILRVIKDLLYIQKFTIKGVKNRLAQIKYNEKYKGPIKVKAINEELKEEMISTLSELKNLLSDLANRENDEN